MKYGVNFKGLHSYDDFEMIMQSDNRQILSNVTRQTQFVSGFGTVDFGNDTYEEKPLAIILQYNYHNQLIMLQQKMEQIGGWLYDDGVFHELIFDDMPNRKFMAKCVGNVSPTKSNGIVTIKITFICNPSYPLMLDNSPVSPADVQKRLLWDTATLDGTQYIQDFLSNGTMDFTVGGTASVKPIIKLIGTIKSGFKLTYNTAIWQYDSDVIFDGIKIDSTAQTVTRLSDGANLYPYVNQTNDEFFTLLVGQQSISVSGVVGAFPNNLTVAVEFTPIGG